MKMYQTPLEVAVECVDEVIASTTYKPGFTFSSYSLEDEHWIALCLTSPPLPDVTRAYTLISLTHTAYYRIEECQTIEDARHCVMSMILSWETHEAQEWLFFDGTKLIAPSHPPHKI